MKYESKRYPVNGVVPGQGRIVEILAAATRQSRVVLELRIAQIDGKHITITRRVPYRDVVALDPSQGC